MEKIGNCQGGSHLDQPTRSHRLEPCGAQVALLNAEAGIPQVEMVDQSACRNFELQGGSPQVEMVGKLLK